MYILSLKWSFRKHRGKIQEGREERENRPEEKQLTKNNNNSWVESDRSFHWEVRRVNAPSFVGKKERVEMIGNKMPPQVFKGEDVVKRFTSDHSLCQY